ELLIPLVERMAQRPGQDRSLLDVVGHGPAAGPLAAQLAGRGLDSVVRLRGFVAEQAKQALVAGSLLHLNTSQGEGWGLCVLEAAALGVPTVAYDVDGLRDSVTAGTSLARRHEAWIVAGPDGDVLAEGPVLDQLIAGGAAVRRQATPLERLTGAGQPS